MAAVLLAWRLLRGAGTAPAVAAPVTTEWLRASAWVLLLVGSAALVIFPLMSVVLQASAGLHVALGQAGNLRRELLASLVFALGASACAWIIAGMVLSALQAPRRLPGLRLAAVALLVPGLCGSLVVGLAGLALCQLPLLRALADTPLPLVTALVLLVLPYALMLRWMSAAAPEAAAWHLAGLLEAGPADRGRAARAVRWQLAGRRQWWAVTLLFLWAYCDLAASAILHPVDMTPVLVRLYNLMHYGQSTALAVQVAMTLLVPLLTIALVHAALRLYRPGGRAAGHGNATS